MLSAAPARPRCARFLRAFVPLCAAALIIAPPIARAETHHAASLAELKSKLSVAVAGDTIVVRNGAYTTTGAISIKQGGEAGNPIVVTAETVGGVELTGTHGFNVVEPASHVAIVGFKLTHASGKNTIGAGTSHVRFSRNTFQCSGDGPYLSVAGDDAEIDHNEFGDKKSAGSMLAVGGTGSQVARRSRIHHNYFHDLANSGTNPAEMIRLGLSTMSLSTGGAIVEHNLFARCRGETEIISSRSCGNTFRFNTLVDSPSALFTLRHGNDCLVYGNTFRSTQGLRIFGDRHQVFSNYFEGNYIAINLGNGSAEVAEGGSASAHDRPDDCVIAFNTLVDNRTHYQMSRRATGALGATNTTFANNVISGSGIAAKIEGPNTDAVWSGNLLWTSGGPGDVPAEGYTKADPLLVTGVDGLKRLQPGSPAIASAVGTYPLVTVDIYGRPRPAKASKGADEPGGAAPLAGVLTPADVGPAAK
jgi:poly(beta-D-mannuronate) lyase